MNHFVEIRSLNLKPGTRDEFHWLYTEEALPCPQRWNLDVVAHGPSVHDESSILHDLNPVAIWIGNMEVGAAPILV